MNVTLDTTYRSKLPEIMDDFEMEGAELRETLDKIASINRLLGGNRLTLSGVKELIADLPKDRTIRILDAGCGNGDMLRELSDWAFHNDRNFELTGIDANADAIAHARELSESFADIQYRCVDFLSDASEMPQYDIIICTLTLHHFSDAEILTLMDRFSKSAKTGIVVNDLQRSALAFRLFQLVCFVFRLPKMPRYDGLVSILRGFKRSELRNFSQKSDFNQYSIRWKWAFRYQWIIRLS